MEQKSKKIGDLLHSKKNYKQSMSQLIDILNIFNLAQNQYLQLREEQDSADIYFKDIGNWVLEFKHKIYNWLKEGERFHNVCKKEQTFR